MKKRLAIPLSYRVLTLCVPMMGSSPVHAHDFDERYGAFLGSFLHPLTALDHGLAFLVVGLWAGQHGRPFAWRGVELFLIGLLIGTLLPWLLSLPSGSVTQLTTVNILSVALLGGLVAWGCSIPTILLLVCGLVGLSHGFENSIDRTIELRSFLSVLGVVMAGLLTASIASTLAYRVGKGWPRVAIRVLGSWIAAIGLMMLGLHLR